MNSKKIFKTLICCLLVVFTFQSTLGQTGTVTVSENPKIPKLLSLKKEMEKDNKLTDAFTIQLYYGTLNRANGILREYRNKYAKWPASIEYETPNYKVWVGNFNSRLDADRALIAIQENFPSAFVLRPNKNKKEEK